MCYAQRGDKFGVRPYCDQGAPALNVLKKVDSTWTHGGLTVVAGRRWSEFAIALVPLDTELLAKQIRVKRKGKTNSFVM